MSLWGHVEMALVSLLSCFGITSDRFVIALRLLWNHVGATLSDSGSKLGSIWNICSILAYSIRREGEIVSLVFDQTQGDSPERETCPAPS